MKRPPPLLLLILDGFGEAAPGPGNAVTLAEPRFYFGLRDRFPWTTLQCSGEEVGLPVGLMGNSEVGHLNIGAGRIVWQEITRIDRAIRTAEFASNPAVVGAFEHCRKSGGTLHLMGLVSDGGVHSSDQHLFELLAIAKQRGLSGAAVVIHAFLDGRDTPPRSAAQYLQALERKCAEYGVGRIATICGRYYAMDRDNRWDRVQRAFDALTAGQGQQAVSAQAGLQAAYDRNENDEFVVPTVIGARDQGRIRNGDAVFFFNFRADRARQLTEAIVKSEFTGFTRALHPQVHFASMTRYRDDLTTAVAFAPQYLKGIFPELVARAGLRQARVAETEKYAHVTFFFSGGDEKEYAGERRILVPSPKVATYDLQPEMSAREVTAQVLALLDDPDRPDLLVVNLANADMVGHTGVLPAAIAAVGVIDEALRAMVTRVLQLGGHVAITADHGNCEMMVDPVTGQPHTAHTTNPVPFLIVGDDLVGRRLRAGGRLSDIAPTLLPFLGLPLGPAMDGVNLL